MKIEPLTVRHRRTAQGRQPGRRRSQRRPVLGDQGGVAAPQGAVLPRPGHSPAPSTWPSPATSASWRTTPWPAATPSTRAWCASTRRPTRPTTATRTPGTPTPPGARSRRWAACCAASNARRWAATPCGPTWSLAYERLPERHQDADRRPARPPQHRGELRRGHADRKAPGAARRSTPMPSIRWCAPIRRPARRCCSSTPSPRTSPTSTRPTTCASARTTSRAPASCCSYLISQAAIPEYQVRWRWKPNSVAIWDNRCHPALRRDGLPALPSKDGTRRHHRRRRPTDTAAPRFTQLTPKDATMNFLDGPCSPKTRTSWSSPPRPTAPSGCLPTFPRTSRSRWKSRCRRRSTATTPAPPCCTCTCANSTARAASACPSSTS